jgi:hypothetical protein
MTVKTIAVVSVLLVTAVLGPRCIAASTSTVPECPKNYPLNGVALTKVPEGWVGEVDERLSLQSASIAVGDPTFENEIIPSESKKVQGGSVVIYDDLAGFPKQRWLVCGYGMTNVVKLYQKLAPGIKRCTMRYAPVHAGTKVQSLYRYHCE